MAAFQRTLTFQCNNLGANSIFIMTFDDPNIPGIYRDVFPTALKVTAFGETGPYSFTVVYNSQLGFATRFFGINPPPQAYTPIDVGQKTTLMATGSPPVYSFSTPQDIGGNDFTVVNGTNNIQDIGLGFFETPDREPSQFWVFENVLAGSSVAPEFTPVLRGYMTSNYQETAVIRSEIRSPVLFNQNLAQLPPVTNWNVTFNPSIRTYQITRDSRIAVDEN